MIPSKWRLLVAVGIEILKDCYGFPCLFLRVIIIGGPTALLNLLGIQGDHLQRSTTNSQFVSVNKEKQEVNFPPK